MANPSVLTGKDGNVTVDDSRVARITKWSSEHNLATSSEWGDSDSEGFTNRAAGRRDATITAEGKYDTDDEFYDLFKEGDMAKLVLFMDSSRYFHYPCALCSKFSIEVDPDTEEVIGWSSDWGSSGRYYYPGESGAGSQSLPS